VSREHSQLCGLLIALSVVSVSTHSGAACAAESPVPNPMSVPMQATPAAKPASLTGTMADVSAISLEMKGLEKHLESLEQSVAAINNSLKRIQSMDQSLIAVSNSLAPVGALTQPERLSALLREAEDLAYERGLTLIFVATGCAAALMVLAAALWRRSDHSARRREGRLNHASTG